MIRFIAGRLGWSLFVLWLVVTSVFVLVEAAGDPARAHLGPQARPEQIQEFRERHGLNRPLFTRYVEYIGGLAHGDLGRSYRNEQPVAHVIAARLPRTALVGALSLLFELLIGLSIGIVAALRRGRPLDHLTMLIAYVGISAPTFLTGVLMLDTLAFRLGWFPVGGYGFGFWDHVHHAVLPALALAIVGACTYARVMRNDLIDVLRQPYIRAAHAKGLSAARVVVRHAVRTALLPIATLVGLSLPLLVSGAIITESVFGWPGMGRLAVESIYRPDAPVIMAVVLVASAAVQVGNLLADMALAALDPRIRDGKI